MIVSKQLRLRVVKGMFCSPDFYEINEDVTILTINDDVVAGKIYSIDDESLTLVNEMDEGQIVAYKDIKDIADTEWLGGSDIREL